MLRTKNAEIGFMSATAVIPWKRGSFPFGSTYIFSYFQAVAK
jgi:hypothetical protein